MGESRLLGESNGDKEGVRTVATGLEGRRSMSYGHLSFQLVSA